MFNFFYFSFVSNSSKSFIGSDCNDQLGNENRIWRKHQINLFTNHNIFSQSVSLARLVKVVSYN